MFHVNHSMKISQYLEYERLKRESPKMSEANFYTAITGSGLCLGKTFFNQIGFVNLSKVFSNCSQTLFWILIVIQMYNGIEIIEKNRNLKTKTASIKPGIWKLVGGGISTIFMLQKFF